VVVCYFSCPQLSSVFFWVLGSTYAVCTRAYSMEGSLRGSTSKNCLRERRRIFFTAHAERQPLAAQPMQSCLRLKISKCLREELNAAQLTQHTMQFPFYLDFMILKKAMLNSRSGCMLSTSQICCCIDNLNYYIIPIVAASLIFPCSYVPGLSDVRVQRHPNGW
jgi:hypothetical protein